MICTLFIDKVMKTMSERIHVLDTNVIIGFASDFEISHDDCQNLFSLEIIKKT